MKKSIIYLGSFLLIFSLLIGCSNGKEDEASAKEREIQPIPSEQPSPSNPQSQTTVGDIVPTITIDQSEGKLVVTFTVKNQTGQDKELTFSSGQKYDFIIKDENGNKVYQWSDEKMFTMAIQTISLKQGEELTFSESLKLNNIGLKPGQYSIEFWLTAKDTNIKAAANFEVK